MCRGGVQSQAEEEILQVDDLSVSWYMVHKPVKVFRVDGQILECFSAEAGHHEFTVLLPKRSVGREHTGSNKTVKRYHSSRPRNKVLPVGFEDCFDVCRLHCRQFVYAKDLRCVRFAISTEVLLEELEVLVLFLPTIAFVDRVCTELPPCLFPLRCFDTVVTQGKSTECSGSLVASNGRVAA